jgi:hypothetical protein
MDVSQVEEIELSMQYILANHPARKDYVSAEEFDNMMEANTVPSDSVNPF